MVSKSHNFIELLHYNAQRIQSSINDSPLLSHFYSRMEKCATKSSNAIEKCISILEISLHYNNISFNQALNELDVEALLKGLSNSEYVGDKSELSSRIDILSTLVKSSKRAYSPEVEYVGEKIDKYNAKSNKRISISSIESPTDSPTEKEDNISSLIKSNTLLNSLDLMKDSKCNEY